MTWSDVDNVGLLNPHVTNATTCHIEMCRLSIRIKVQITSGTATRHLVHPSLRFANLLYFICFVFVSVYCHIVEEWLSS